MRLIAKFYRIAKVKTNALRAAAGAPPDADGRQVWQALLDRYGPMAPTIRVFWPPSPEGETQPSDECHDGHLNAIVGIEVMSFDVPDMPKVPFSGLIEHEPLDPPAIHRLDGALVSELLRIGIVQFAEKNEWRCWYEVK